MVGCGEAPVRCLLEGGWEQFMAGGVALGGICLGFPSLGCLGGSMLMNQPKVSSVFRATCSLFAMEVIRETSKYFLLAEGISDSGRVRVLTCSGGIP